MTLGGTIARWGLSARGGLRLILVDSTHQAPPVIGSDNAHRCVGNPPCGFDTEAGDVTLRLRLTGGTLDLEPVSPSLHLGLPANGVFQTLHRSLARKGFPGWCATRVECPAGIVVGPLPVRSQRRCTNYQGDLPPDQLTVGVSEHN
jgi:hypothetical protein